MRLPNIKEGFWAGLAIGWSIQALKVPNDTARAVYVLCAMVCLATAFLLKEIREK